MENVLCMFCVSLMGWRCAYRLYVYDVPGFVAHVLKSMPIVQTTEVSALQSRSREDDVWA